MGSDDGTVKIWRDVSDSESGQSEKSNLNSNIIASVTAGGSGINGGLFQEETSGITLASAFAALPDIADTSKGQLFHCYMH